MTGLRFPRDASTLRIEEAGELDVFVQAGMVRLESFQVIYCADIEDPDNEADPWCETWLVPHSREELECTECDRLIFHEPEDRRERLRVRLDREGVERWLQERLQREGEVERLRGGVAWRVVVDDEEIVVAVLDWSEETRWTRAERMGVDPTVLVLLEPDLYRHKLREGVVAIDLVELMAALDLADVWERCRGAEIQCDKPMAWLPVHTLPSRYRNRVLGAHRLDAADGALQLDGFGLLEGGGGVFPVVRWLVARHAEDVQAGKAPEDHCWWPAQEVADEVSAAIGATVTRSQVKRGLSRFAVTARERYLAEVGMDLGLDGVIESCRGGYRVAPAICGRFQ